MVEKIGGIGGSGPILTKRCLSRLLCQPKSSKWPRQPGHEQLWACPSHMSIASRARGCMRRLESRTSCAHSQGFSRKADRVRRCRTDARSSSRSARPVAAAAAYLVRPERAADCRTPLPSPPLCHPSCGSTIRLGNVSSHFHLGQSNHHIVAVIALVRHHFLYAFRMHFVLAFGRLLCDQASDRDAGFNHRFFHRCRVGGGSAMRSHSDDGAGLHVHGILGFISQSRAPVFQFRDLGFLVARAFPVLIGSLLLTLAVHAE